MSFVPAKVMNFYNFLTDKSVADRTTLKDTFNAVQQDPVQFLLRIIQRGILSKKKAMDLWSECINIAYLNLNETTVQKEALELIPEKVAERYNLIGVYIFGSGMTVAMAAPWDLDIIRELETLTRRNITPVFCLPDEIKAAIQIYYKSSQSIENSVKKIDLSAIVGKGGYLNIASMRKLAMSDSIIDLSLSIVLYALRERATDIHLEPREGYLSIRFRIDGKLQEKFKLPSDLINALSSRFKIISQLDITERRLPQDGSFTINIGTHKLDFRLSSMPSKYGEKLVIRVLGQSSTISLLNLDRMFINDDILSKVKKIIQTPNGVFFVTGPTGSGKTTTLYAALNYINDPGSNIITIEDPIEYTLEGIVQVQVDIKVGLTFSTVLRSVLRQDPDIVLVGEIRDAETARIATQAALTGHLVFSSLHTNSSVQALTRLVEMGVEPFMVAPSIIGVLAQRLVRKLCEQCKEPYQATKDDLQNHFKLDCDSDVTLYRAKGCPNCNFSGYYGRVAIHELVVITDEVREMVYKNASAQDIEKVAFHFGFRPMRYDGFKKVLRGFTTFSEIVSSTVIEQEIFSKT